MSSKNFRVGQEGIRDYFGVGQTVLVRRGTDWVSRASGSKIMAISL